MSTTAPDPRVAGVRPATEASPPVQRPPVEARWRDYDGTTYYGMQAVKPSPFDWRISAYLLVSGVAGSAQIIAALAERIGPQRMHTVARNARYLAVPAAASGALLLITDLKTPNRFYNMLRIFRSTSPMSWGSYVLSAFGALSGVTALGQFLRRLPAAARAGALAQVPAAAAGAGMLTYTGAMLSSTSTPLWAAESPLLSARFAASGFATGAAVLSLAERGAQRPRNAEVLDRLMLTGIATYGVISGVAHRRLRARGHSGPLEEPPYGRLYQLGAVLTVGVPLLCYGIGLVSRRHAGLLGAASSIAVVAGTALSRHAYLYAGMESARQAATYLRYAAGEEASGRSGAGKRAAS